MGKVRIERGQANLSILPNDKGPRNRQLIRRVAIIGRQIQAKTGIAGFQFFSRWKDQPIGAGDLVANITQDLERQMVLLGHGARVLQRLRRNRNKTCAQRVYLSQVILVRLQLQVTVRSPLASIESDHSRATLEYIR